MRNQFRNRTYSWPLERVAALAAVAVVVFTAAVIVVPAWLIGSRETTALASRMNAAIVGDAKREIESLFERIGALQETARSVLSAGAVKIDDKVGREALFMGLLRADPSISWVSFGFENGDFYGANRREQAQYRLVESKWDVERKTAIRQIDYYAGYEGSLYQTHSKTVENDYHAAGRSWFKAASTSEGAIWTDVYRFASTGHPGLNTAIQVEQAGEPVGGGSIAIELNRLDHWLQARMAGREGMAFLLGPDRKLLASSETKFSDAAVEGQPSPSLADRSIFEALAPYLASKQAGAWDIDDSAFGGRAFLNVTPVGLQGWTVGTLLSERAFAGDILAERRRMLMASAAALALVALLAVVVTRRLFVAPLQAASRELKRFRRFELAGRRPLRSNIAEVAELGRGLESARQSLLAFSRYAPTELARKLMADAGHGEQAVERGTITILFLDLEGFTAATERLGHRLAPQLNAFLAAMTDEVREAGGTVDKFIGDAVMALFGAPDADEEHALNACKAALGCITALERLNKGWAEAGLPTFRMRIGVNTGRVLVGSIGAPDRLNYTAIGDPVNLAARLESLNREYGTRIMLGAQTFDLVKYDIAARRLDAVRVKGKTERVPVYELLELALGGARIEPAEWVKRYEAGLDALHDGQPEVARRCFLEVTETRGADPASAAMLARLPVPARDPAFDKLEEAAAAFSGRAAGG